MEAKKFTKEASQRLSLFEEEYERVGTVLTCGMAVMEARMTRTKRDVSVGIHSSSHGHEIMSDFTSPGPFRHKTARVTAVVSHGSGAEDRLTPIPLILPFGSCWNWTGPNTIAILALGLHTGDFAIQYRCL